MLNIPDSVKALFKQDGVYKNFRAHFPNGELSDITNSDIVQESVKFTESVCSQDVFKFGLTEASVIEFETVGVGNMYGMTIECSCEIDCSSLPAADKATIAAGAWDGTWDGVNEVFAVPYGTFRVESCPRDHQAMAHRKVTAYTEVLTKNPVNPYEKARLDTELVNNEKYSISIDKLFLANFGYSNPELLYEDGYTRQTAYDFDATVSGYSHTYQCKDSQGNVFDRKVTFSYVERYIRDIKLNPDTTAATKDLLGIEMFSYDLSPFYEVRDWFAENYTVVGQEGYNPIPHPFSWRYERFVKNSVYYSNYIPISGDIPCFSVYRGDAKSANDYYRVCVRLIQSISVLSSSGYVLKSASQPISLLQYVHINKWTSNNVVPELDFEATSCRKRAPDGKTVYAFADSYDLREIAQGYLELSARFMAQGRNGKVFKRLSSESQAAITPGEYSQMWFDEYTVEPIGTIRYSYTDEAGEEQIVDYQFGDGESIYDMTDNEVLKMMDVADSSVIEAMLDAYFIPHIAAVNFVPIDLSMKGLPYLEAGDAISVTAQDGTVCNSYALRHEISGIQALEAQIDSQSGLIIESEAATT